MDYVDPRIFLNRLCGNDAEIALVLAHGPRQGADFTDVFNFEGESKNQLVACR